MNKKNHLKNKKIKTRKCKFCHVLKYLGKFLGVSIIGFISKPNSNNRKLLFCTPIKKKTNIDLPADEERSWTREVEENVVILSQLWDCWRKQKINPNSWWNNNRFTNWTSLKISNVKKWLSFATACLMEVLSFEYFSY